MCSTSAVRIRQHAAFQRIATCAMATVVIAQTDDERVPQPVKARHTERFHLEMRR
jgi:hypothetical protein